MRNKLAVQYAIFENGLKNNPMYLYQSLYYTHLSRWMKFFPRNQIFIIFLDDLKNNPKAVIQNLYIFLGVDTKYEPAMVNQRIHETRLTANTTFESFIKKSASALRQIGFGTLIDLLKNKGLSKTIAKINSKEEDQAFPPMEEKTRKELLKYFYKENNKLADLVNRDLPGWNK